MTDRVKPDRGRFRTMPADAIRYQFRPMSQMKKVWDLLPTPRWRQEIVLGGANRNVFAEARYGILVMATVEMAACYLVECDEPICT